MSQQVLIVWGEIGACIFLQLYGKAQPLCKYGLNCSMFVPNAVYIANYVYLLHKENDIWFCRKQVGSMCGIKLVICHFCINQTKFQDKMYQCGILNLSKVNYGTNQTKFHYSVFNVNCEDTNSIRNSWRTDGRICVR